MARLKENELNEKLAKDRIDITLPANDFTYGTLHPLTLVQQEIEDIFVAMGYAVLPL